MSGVTRREFLESLALVAISVKLAGCDSVMMMPSPSSSFFTDDERALLQKLCNYVFPEDDTPGATSLGAVTYIENLLTAFDSDPPRLFAGGPFSGRQPFIDPTTGMASANRPPNSFATWMPLSRVAAAGWRLRLYGSSGVSGGGPNDAALGPVVGWRDLFKQGLDAAIQAAQAAGTPVAQLDDADLDKLWSNLSDSLKTVLTTLTIEGVFCAPEYGGNLGGKGWQFAHFEGDSQPLGYSQFDQTAGIYRERADAPLSTANPGPDPDPMTSDTSSIIAILTKSLNGRVA